MYELVKVSDHDYYVDCPAKIGIVQISDSEVVLIDSGSDKDAAKKVFRILEDNKWTLKAIFNTHSHADHIGGNAFLQEKTGCKVYVNGVETALTEYTLLEPAYLFGGLPVKELYNKFLMAKPSKVSPLSDDTLPSGMSVIQLPGHSASMTGFLTSDGTAFVGDSVSSEETLTKYKVGYLWNPEDAVKSLEFLKTVGAKRFVPSHAPMVERIEELADFNIKSIREVEDLVEEFCREPIAFECLLKKTFDYFSINMTAQQYVLIGSTLRSYLSSLYSRGRLVYEFVDNEMKWRKSV